MAWNYRLIEKRIFDLECKPSLDTKEKIALAQLRYLLGIYDNFMFFKYQKSDEQIFPILQERATIYNDIWKDEKLRLKKTQEVDFSLDEALEIMHDFYMEQSDTFKKAFLQLFKERSNIINVSDSDSYTFYISIFKQTYINITKDKTMNFLSDLVHEFAHGMASVINEDFNNNKNYSLITEVNSIYFQKKFLDYLFKNNIYPELALNEEIRYDKFINSAGKSIINNKYLLDCWDECTYFNSFLVAIELYMNENGLDYLEKILLETPQDIYEGAIAPDKYIEVNKNIENYQKKLIILNNQYNK